MHAAALRPEHVYFAKPFVLAAAILGFAFWWPVGLAILAFGFGMLKCARHQMAGEGGGFGRWCNRRQGGGDDDRGWRRDRRGGSGNRAFDEYRAETLRRLEEEQKEFRDFLDRLRFARDKAEFDAFLAERRGNTGAGQGGATPPVA